MRLESQFNNGDIVWVVDGSRSMAVTVGLVRVEVTDSPGIEGEETFDNYMPQQGRKEEYMAVESGIGTGIIYTLGRNIFATEAECEAAVSAAMGGRPS